MIDAMFNEILMALGEGLKKHQLVFQMHPKTWENLRDENVQFILRQMKTEWLSVNSPTSYIDSENRSFQGVPIVLNVKYSGWRLVAMQEINA